VTKQQLDDGLHRLARAAIGVMPVGSGTALEMLNLFIQDPYQRRRSQWLHDLSFAVNSMSALADERNTLSQLRGNP